MSASASGNFVVPRPATLYVHDDLSEDIGAQYGTTSSVYRLTRHLLSLVAADTSRVKLLSLEEQLDALIRRGPRKRFARALGIGAAGERVARQIHARTGWLPAIQRVDIRREEEQDGYRLASPGGVPLTIQIARLGSTPSLAVIDDTIFSGLTMETVLRTLPARGRRHAEVLCLRGVGESLRRVAALCPVTAGFEAGGRLLIDVSFINASGLVRRGSIRRNGRAPLAFFERREWMRAWFPARTDEIVGACRTLHALLTGSTSLP